MKNISSIKYKILTIIIAVTVIYLIFFYNFYRTSKENYNIQNQLNQKIIIATLKEKTIKFLDKMVFDYLNIKDELITYHKLTKQYLQNKEPLKVDLYKLKTKLKLDKNCDIYICDDNLTIKNTTFKNDLGFNLSFAKDDFLKHKQQNIIGISPPIFETSTKNFFSYTDSYLMPPNDKKILQISYNYKDYKTFINPIKKFLIQNNIIDFKIFVKSDDFAFDIKINDYKSYKPSLDEINKRIQESLQTFKNLKDKQIYVKRLDNYKKAIYFYETNPILNTKFNIAYYILVDESKYFHTLHQQNINFLIAFILGMLFIGVVYLILNKIINKLDILKKAIIKNDIVNLEDFQANDEIALLASNYNQMTYNIKEQIKQKEELIKMQDEFIKDSTHELNTPLTTIILNSNLRDKVKGKDKYSSQINTAVKTLKIIHDDLLFGIKHNRLDLQSSTINLSLTLQDRIQYFEDIASNNTITIKETIQNECYTTINETELQRVIDNNISNGVKYSYPNTTFEIKLYKKENNIILDFLTVSDAIQHKNDIFNRYNRESSTHSGFGLGLNIVKQIANKYNISIEVDRVEDKTLFRYIFKGI